MLTHESLFPATGMSSATGRELTELPPTVGLLRMTQVKSVLFEAIFGRPRTSFAAASSSARMNSSVRGSSYAGASRSQATSRLLRSDALLLHKPRHRPTKLPLILSDDPYVPHSVLFTLQPWLVLHGHLRSGKEWRTNVACKARVLGKRNPAPTGHPCALWLPCASLPMLAATC